MTDDAFLRNLDKGLRDFRRAFPEDFKKKDEGK